MYGDEEFIPDMKLKYIKEINVTIETSVI